MAESRHDLTVPEQRLILWLVAQIQKTDDAFHEHTLDVAAMKAILGSNNGRLYEQIQSVCALIQTRILEIKVPGERKRKSFNWLHMITYHDGEGRVTMRFHDELAPYLLALQGYFCKVPLVPAFRLRGGYSIRWLEMLCAQEHFKSWPMSVDELREWLHIDKGQLEAVKDLRVKAIDLPRRELDKKSPLTFTYEPTMQGRKIVGWIFTVRANKPEMDAKKPKAGEDEEPTQPDVAQPADQSATEQSFDSIWSVLGGRRKALEASGQMELDGLLAGVGEPADKTA